MSCVYVIDNGVPTLQEIGQDLHVIQVAAYGGTGHLLTDRGELYVIGRSVEQELRHYSDVEYIGSPIKLEIPCHFIVRLECGGSFCYAITSNQRAAEYFYTHT